MAKKKKPQKKPQKYFGGLSYGELLRVNKVGFWFNDLTWAGRLYKRYPSWIKRLSMVITISLSLGIISLVLIWGSIITRAPVLLLGVYPDGRVVCMPRIYNRDGTIAKRHKSYGNMCSNLFDKAGLSWVVEEAKKNNGKMPHTDPAAENNDPAIEFQAPQTTINYLIQKNTEKEATKTEDYKDQMVFNKTESIS